MLRLRFQSSLTEIVLFVLMLSAFVPASYAQPPTPRIEDNFNFENGLLGWTKTGKAFDSQPVDATRIRTDQAEAGKLGGDYWRSLAYPVGQNGQYLILTENALTGTLTTRDFMLTSSAPYFSFLIGGSADLNHERLELQIRVDAALEADDLQRRIAAWTHEQGGSWKAISTHDGDYIIALAATAEKGADGLDLELLRQKWIRIPDFLSGRTARLKIVDDSATAHINIDFIRFMASQPSSHDARVWGYADYHTHPMSYLAFGGLKGVHTLWGKPGGAYRDYVNHPELVSKDIPHCVKRHCGGLGAEIFINSAEQRLKLGGLFKTLWDLVRGRLTRHGRSGGPEFRDFPSFLSGAHQQMHITQIRRNYEGGLRLMVAIAVHNQGAEYLASKARKERIDPSSEKDVVEAQVCAMRRLAELNRDWMEIAYSPDQARRIIRQNKLAIILGIEVDRLGELDPKLDTAKEEVEYLWKLGIRAVSPIHAVDNRIGGASVFLDVYNWLNDFLHRKDLNDPPKETHFFHVRDSCENLPQGFHSECTAFRLNDKSQNRLVIKRIPILGSFPFPQSVRAPEEYQKITGGHKNANGLTSPESGGISYGATYIEELMNAGMILDAIHMSDLSRDGLYEVIGNRLARDHPDCKGFTFYSDIAGPCYQQAYPTIVSHAHFRTARRQTGKDFVSSEYDVSDRNIEIVRRIEGVIGPFVTEDPISPPVKLPLLNDCGMSSKTFAYSFEYGLQQMGGKGLGMATDYSFIPAVAPRFGRRACWGFHLAEKPSEERRKNKDLYKLKDQDNGVLYSGLPAAKGVKAGNNLPLEPYQMGGRVFDFNVDGLAHFGLVPDMLQDLKNLGMPAKNFEALFSSAEDYLQMWEKTWRISGCNGSSTRCFPDLTPLNCEKSGLECRTK